MLLNDMDDWRSAAKVERVPALDADHIPKGITLARRFTRRKRLTRRLDLNNEKSSVAEGCPHTITLCHSAILELYRERIQ